MSGHKELQHQQQELHMDRQMEQFQQDQKTIQQLQEKPKSGFHFSRRKNLVRNYRDFALARAMRQEEPAGVPYAQVRERLEARKNMESARPVTVPTAWEKRDTPLTELLRVQDAVGNLCRCPLAVKVISPSEMSDLLEHLSAGEYLEEKDPGFDQMRQAGLKALHEIYYRLLEKINDKYGSKLTGISAEKYLKRRDEIEADLGCLKDMKLFLGTHEQLSGQGYRVMQSRIEYYLDTMEVIRQRSDAITEGMGEQLTEKGELTREARKSYEDRMKALLVTAKEKNAFRKRPSYDVLPVAENFEAAHRLRTQAREKYLSLRTEAESPIFDGLERDLEIKRLRKKVDGYNFYVSCQDILKYDKDEKSRARAQKGLDRYRSDPENDVFTLEQCNAVQDQIEALQGGGGDLTVTQDNLAEVLNQCLGAYGRMRYFMESTSDRNFMYECDDVVQLAIKMGTQVQNVVRSDAAADVLKRVQAHEQGKKPLQPEEYKSLKELAEQYSVLRTAFFSNEFLPDHVVDVISNRLKSISEFGCTQNVTRTATTNPVDLRRTLVENMTGRELRLEEEKLRVQIGQKQRQLSGTWRRSHRRQLEKEIRLLEARASMVRRKHASSQRVNRLDRESLDAMQANPEMAMGQELEENLQKMTEAVRLKETDAGAYQLSGGFEAWCRRETLSGLEPFYRKGLELTAMRYQLKDRGNMTQEETEEQWKAAVKAYRTRFIELEDRFSRMELGEDEVDIGYSKVDQELMDEKLNKLRQEYCSQALCQSRVRQEALERELEQTEENRALLADRAWSFADTDRIGDVKQELKRLQPLERLKGTDQAPDQEALDAGLHMVRRLTGQLARCMEAFGPGLTEEKVLANHHLIERAVLMEESVTRLLGDGRVLNTLTEQADRLSEEDRKAVRRLREDRGMIRALYQYSAGLQLQQAGTLGVKEMDCLYAGEMLHLSSPELLRHTGNILLQRGRSVLEPLLERRGTAG